MRTGIGKCAANILAMCLAAVAIAAVAPGDARSVMPKEVYERAARASAIKAVAVVREVRVLAEGPHDTLKEALFEREFALTSDTPETFTGVCHSVETPAQRENLMMGGTIYYYPRKGDRVFVTISADGGSITSMTDLTPGLEEAVRNHPSRIRYGFGRAYVESEKGSPTPQVRGKEPVSMRPVSPAGLNGDLGGQLLAAIGTDDLDEAARLLGAGADPNHAVRATGMTPLMTVRVPAMARLLVENGADPLAVDTEGGTLLHYAVSQPGATGLIPYFVSLGVDPNQRGWENEPPLFAALNYFLETFDFDQAPPLPGESDGPVKKTGPPPGEVFRALLKAGADINARDEYGNTALMTAVVQNNGGMVRLLLDLGADKDIATPGGSTARDMAYELGHRYLYQMLE